ncbi:hypothetical protein F5887DRAFT_1059428 [Amanita rubescens]|nr:hypothetical protein F5887DRAFT_1059428 [Amanita rubescens]
MAIFLTGGTGNTANHIAHLLQDANIPFLLGSRRGETAAPAGMVATKFDWLDPSTFSNPFQYNFPGEQRISAIYLVLASVVDPGPANTFIDYAFKTHHVKRFVLLAGSSAQLGGPAYGQIWQHLLDLGVEYCVLRPTWFMENFCQRWHLATIQDKGKIYTACREGKIPFISAMDVAAVAFRALTDEKAHNTDYLLEGAELLNHDQVAAKLSNVLGREILHVKETRKQVKQRYITFGLDQSLAEMLAWFEEQTPQEVGEDINLSDAVERATGRAPLTFDAFLEQNRAAWSFRGL